MRSSFRVSGAPGPSLNSATNLHYLGRVLSLPSLDVLCKADKVPVLPVSILSFAYLLHNERVKVFGNESARGKLAVDRIRGTFN